MALEKKGEKEKGKRGEGGVEKKEKEEGEGGELRRKGEKDMLREEREGAHRK